MNRFALALFLFTACIPHREPPKEPEMTPEERAAINEKYARWMAEQPSSAYRKPAPDGHIGPMPIEVDPGLCDRLEDHLNASVAELQHAEDDYRAFVRSHCQTEPVRQERVLQGLYGAASVSEEIWVCDGHRIEYGGMRRLHDLRLALAFEKQNALRRCNIGGN